MWFDTQDVGIDLGTATVQVYVRNKGIVLSEPSVVAVRKSDGSLLSVGEDARRMLGRTPNKYRAVRPLREGVISDYDLTERMLHYYLNRALGKKRWLKPKVIVCVPSGVSETEKRSVIMALNDAGMGLARLIEEPVAAAIGAGLNITHPQGTMVVDIGGGTTDIAVLSMKAIVLSSSVRVGGDQFDEAIIRYMRKKHNLFIGERTAEELKIEIGSAYPRREEVTMRVAGRNLVTGLPRYALVTGTEIMEALEEPVDAIVDAVHTVMEKIPPELAGDIYEQGILLTGGGAQLFGLDRLLQEVIRVRCTLAENPENCVALGIGKVLENLTLYKSLLFDYHKRQR